jgi:ABC-type spermidine/putrescine transport system permease subunit I
LRSSRTHALALANWLTLLVVFPLYLNLVVRTFGWIALLAQNGLVNRRSRRWASSRSR